MIDQAGRSDGITLTNGVRDNSMGLRTRAQDTAVGIAVQYNRVWSTPRMTSLVQTHCCSLGHKLSARGRATFSS